MGLEAGWNCHISLLSEGDEIHEGHSVSPTEMLQSSKSRRLSNRESSNSLSKEKDRTAGKGTKSHSDTPTTTKAGRRCSAPGAINLEATQVS